MSLATMTAFLFDKTVRAKGEGLYVARRIQVDAFGPERMVALVKGGNLYEVRISKLAGAQKRRLLAAPGVKIPIVEFCVCAHAFSLTSGEGLVHSS